MSEILNKRLKESVGKDAKIFLNNGWRFTGKITNCDDEYVELLDYKIDGYKLIRIEDIKDCEVKE